MQSDTTFEIVVCFLTHNITVDYGFLKNVRPRRRYSSSDKLRFWTTSTSGFGHLGFSKEYLMTTTTSK